MSTAVYSMLTEHFDQSLGLQRRLRLPRAILASVAAISVLILLWMAVAHVDRVVHTQGRVIPSGKQQMLQHLEGGIVSKVFVREGDQVRAGQALIAVSDLQAGALRGEKQARLNGLTARASRLQAESDGAGSYTVPQGVDASQPQVRNEAAAFAARQLRLSQTLRVITEQLAQRQQEMAEQEVRRRGLSDELATSQQQATLIANLVARKAGSQLELLDSRSRVERLQSQIRESEAAVPRLLAAQQELEARRAEAQAQFRSESRTSLADTRVELQRLQQEINADDDRIRRTVVTAPMSGHINKVNFNTVGGVVKPGDVLMELTPDEESLVVEARVPPQERGSLQVGQRAVVKVAAFDFTVFGTLDARVTEISPDTIADEKGERYFRMSLAVDPKSVEQFGQNITPGLTVSADAVTGSRTILQYLLSPIRGLGGTAFRDRK
ncbi:MAG: HlyD family type I secretion periplasmic adaptor subunit [Proteobacteria bacterium]|nr:HlyD family type I secretion periplasmic adaptor subunit [Pseudomonadota bacterium]